MEKEVNRNKISFGGSSRYRLHLMGLVALGLLPAQNASAYPIGSMRGAHRLYRPHPLRRTYRGSLSNNRLRLHRLRFKPTARKVTPISHIATTHVSVPQTHNSVTNLFVVAEGDGTRFIVQGTDPFTPEINATGQKTMTVITIPGAWNAGESGSRTVGQNGIDEVWYGASSELANSVRIVANTEGRLPFSTVSSPDHRRWEIKVWAPNTKPSPLTALLLPRGDTFPTVVTDSVALASNASGTTKPVVNSGVVAANTASTAATTSTTVASTVNVPQGVRDTTTSVSSSNTIARPVVIHSVAAHSKVAPLPSSGKDAAKRTAPQRVKVPVTSISVPNGNGIYPSLLKTPIGYASARKNEILAGSAEPSTTSSGRDGAKQDDEEKRVSLDFIAADINDVLKALSLQSGINIVTGADVKGTITVSLNRVPMSEALDMVTRLSGFKYDRSGSAYVVGTPISLDAFMKGRTEAPITEFIPYRYTTQAELTRTLLDRFPGLNLPAPDKTDTNTSPSTTRLVVLTDTKERVAAVRSFVQRLEEARALPTIGATIEVYRVQYASATDLVTILARLVPTVAVQLGPGQGFQSGSSGASASYTSNSPTGGGGAGGSGPATPAGAQASGNAPQTLLLTGIPSDIARAREVLAQVDIKTATLQFEAKVVDINSTDAKNLGVTYDFNNAGTGVRIGERDATGSGAGTTGGTIQNNTTLGAKVPNFGAIYRYPYSIGLQLQAVINNNKGRVLANPNLSALDGQPAVVFIGDQIKYVTNVQVTTTGTTIQTETAQVGVTLKVTGKSSPDGTITLYVHPEVSSVSSFLSLANGVSLPQIATRYVDTTIRVKDGETIGIGGLIRESDINNVQKVPLLGDIPFFGQLFRNTNRTKERSEVIIMITSRIQKD